MATTKLFLQIGKIWTNMKRWIKDKIIDFNKIDEVIINFFTHHSISHPKLLYSYNSDKFDYRHEELVSIDNREATSNDICKCISIDYNDIMSVINIKKICGFCYNSF